MDHGLIMARISASCLCLSFMVDGHWATAMKLVHGIADPYQRQKTGATECELEVALGELKVEEDLRRRTRNILNGDCDEETHDDKTKSLKGKGRGGKDKGKGDDGGKE